MDDMTKFPTRPDIGAKLSRQVTTQQCNGPTLNNVAKTYERHVIPPTAYTDHAMFARSTTSTESTSHML